MPTAKIGQFVSFFYFCCINVAPARAQARGIVAEPPVGAGLMRTSGAHPARARSAQRVMERIARRRASEAARRLAQRNFASQNSIKN
jgi:hypothetical protein